MKNNALIIEKTEFGTELNYRYLENKKLMEDEVLVKVAFSGINYKDRLAIDPATKVVRQLPMVPGIDFSGTVSESRSDDFRIGDEVFLTGQGYGTDRFGGFQEYVVADAQHLCRVPEGLSLREVMLYGTAGFTAALSVDALMNGHDLKGKDILVTGGTGGVSSHAIMILRKLGANVTAATRSDQHADFLKSLGAENVMLFDALLEKRRALSEEKWDGVIDATGGEALGNLLTEVRYGGILAASGNLSGIRFESTVFPFILRGITLKGIDSVYAGREKKIELFEKLGKEWKSEHLLLTAEHEVKFADLKDELMKSKVKSGRTLVQFY